MPDEHADPAAGASPISARVVKKSHHAKPPVAKPRTPAAVAPAAVAAVATRAVPLAAPALKAAKPDGLESAVDAALSVFGWS